MKTKHPYTWPHRSRAAMTDYLIEHESYGGWNHPYRHWSPLSWNVKLNPSWEGKAGDYKTNDALDHQWNLYCTTGAGSEYLWDEIVKNMRRHYTDSEYTTYPGDDQGDWKFCFAGRSGGHMLLEEWKHGCNFLKDIGSEDGWREYLDSRTFSTLNTLYRAVRCMDHDFTREKMNAEFDYNLTFRRWEWEEEYRRNEKFSQAQAGLEPCPAI